MFGLVLAALLLSYHGVGPARRILSEASEGKTADRVTQEDGEACLCLRRPRLTCDLTFTHCFLHTYFLPDCDLVIKGTHTHSHTDTLQLPL